MDRENTWDGVERRSGEDRREQQDRRAAARSVWERRSGFDRRGHKLYAKRSSPQPSLTVVGSESLGDTG